MQIYRQREGRDSQKSKVWPLCDMVYAPIRRTVYTEHFNSSFTVLTIAIILALVKFQFGGKSITLLSRPITWQLILVGRTKQLLKTSFTVILTYISGKLDRTFVWTISSNFSLIIVCRIVICSSENFRFDTPIALGFGIKRPPCLLKKILFIFL